MLYVTDFDFEDDDDGPSVILGKSRSSERRSFRLLSSVSSYWHQTLIGWPESPTSQWVKLQIKKMIERKCRHILRLCTGVEHSDLCLKKVVVT